MPYAFLEKSPLINLSINMCPGLITRPVPAALLSENPLSLITGPAGKSQTAKGTSPLA